MQKKWIIVTICVVLFLGIASMMILYTVGSMEQENNYETVEVVEVEKNECQYPDEETVRKVRELAVEGMNDKEIEEVSAKIIKINKILEQYTGDEVWMDAISDPSNPVWKILDKTGEVIIGYSYEEGVWEKMESSGLTEEEFAKKYGQPVYYNNEYDAAMMQAELREIQDIIKNKSLKEDIDNVISAIGKLKETHDDEYYYYIAEIFHDMDYFLFRYGPSLALTENEEIRESLRTYYGRLTMYKDYNCPD